MDELMAEFNEYWNDFNRNHPDKPYKVPESSISIDPLYSRYYLTEEGLKEYRSVVQPNNI